MNARPAGGQHAAVVGLGEAGAQYATALIDAGYTVTGFDPGLVTAPQGVRRADTVAEAVADAGVVFVLTASKVARTVAETCYEAIGTGTCYADFTSSSPAAMRDIAELVDRAGAEFCDVAILGAIAWSGARTPLLVAGRGAPQLAELVSSWGAPVEQLDGPPGSAMAHKLLRSVMMKGLASVVIEAVTAGAAAGYEPWIRDQIAAQLAGDGHAVIDRLISGTQLHAARRAQEMHDTIEYLTELGVPAEMSGGTEAALRRLATQRTV